MMGFFRFGGGLLFAEDRIRLGLDLTAYQLGIQPFQEGGRENPETSLFVSLPLLNIGISGGFTIPVIPWRLPFQPYIETVFALRLLTEGRLIIDPLFPLELRLEPGLEWEVSRHVDVFVGLSNTFTFMTMKAFRDLLSQPENNSFTVLAPWLYFSGPVPLIGVRIGL
jgi:hypothetical protein